MEPRKTIGSRHRKRALYLYALLMAMCTGLVLFAVPLFLVQKLQTSVFKVGLTGSLGALSYSLFCLCTGRLSDRVGRKRIIILGIALFVCGYFLISFCCGNLFFRALPTVCLPLFKDNLQHHRKNPKNLISDSTQTHSSRNSFLQLA